MVPEYHSSDPNAIKLLDLENKFVGYVPREFTEGISNLLAMGCSERTEITWNIDKEITVTTRISVNGGNSTTTGSNEEAPTGVSESVTV